MVPEKIPNIFNGEKTVIYGLLMENSEQKGEGLKCKATLTGNILGKEFKFDIPFELTEEQSVEDVSVIHQLAVKKIIQEWQDDEEPYEQKHKKEIIELSTDASVVSSYTAYIAVDVAQNKPASGSMQSYELTAVAETCDVRVGRRLKKGGATAMMKLSKSPSPMKLESSVSRRPRCSAPLMISIDSDSAPLMKSRHLAPQIKFGSSEVERSLNQQYSILTDSRSLNQQDLILTDLELHLSIESTSSPAKQTGVDFIVSLQQANGSWLLSDQLAGVVSKSVEELKSCCPLSCDDIVIANIWATLVVIELLKKKYPSMLEELELIIMKAEQWLRKQPLTSLPSGVSLDTLKENAIKII